MPLNQDKFLATLKAAAAYRARYQRFVEGLEQEMIAAQYAELRLPLPTYISNLRSRVLHDLDELDREYKAHIDLCLMEYTPARVARNEKLKIRQRIRRTGSADAPIRATIPFEPKPQEVDDIPTYNQLPSHVSQEAFDELMRKLNREGEEKLRKQNEEDDQIFPEGQSLRGE